MSYPWPPAACPWYTCQVAAGARRDMPLLKGTHVPLRRHGDEMERLPGGYYRAHGRCDDTMNISGIKCSSVQIERVCHDLSGLKGVVEVAAVGVPPPEGGPELLYLFAVLTGEAKALPIDQVRLAFQLAIKEHLNPLFKVHEVIAKDLLPRTTNNKVLRRCEPGLPPVGPSGDPPDFPLCDCPRRKLRDEVKKLFKRSTSSSVLQAAGTSAAVPIRAASSKA